MFITLLAIPSAWFWRLATAKSIFLLENLFAMTHAAAFRTCEAVPASHPICNDEYHRR